MTNSGARTLIVGLDGATWELADRLMAEGRMPTLARLVQEGARAPLNSTTPPMTLPSWSSMLTGCNPGRHGIFDFVRKTPGEWALEFTNSTHRAVPTWMRVFSDRGMRAASIAVPTTWPPEPIDGVMISGFDGPVSTGIDASFCHPAGLYREIKERFGGMKFADFQESRIGDGWHDDALDALLREIPRKQAIAEWLLSQERWDGFMVLFGESDTVSHHFWMFHDEDSPRHQAGASSRLRSAIELVYQRLDEALGALIERAGADHVAVVSDHGFGGAGVHALYLNRYLEQHGWLQYKRDVTVGGLASGSGLASKLRAAAATRIPSSLQGKVYRAVPSAVLGSLETQSRYGDLDMEHTRAVSDEMNYAATIRLNLPESDPAARRAAYEALQRLLLDWTVEGHKVVARVHLREDLYEGSRVTDSPDIVIELNERDGYTYTLLPSARVPKGTTWRRLSPAEYAGGKGLGMNGTHRQYGVLALWGEGVRAGATVDAGMADVVPTLLHLMGEAIPAHMDGSVIMDALMGSEQPVASEAMAQATPPKTASEAEADALRSRLERLGYL
ncbi:MAG: alkaline phosphatase family protein [Myxococcota bacterium]|nr:alkaline phosphatase family protein [Myxococcota bacterium]